METRGVNCNNGQAQLTVDKGTASVSTSGAVRNKQDHQVKVPLAKEKQNPAPMAEKGSALAAASGLRQAPVLLTLFFLDEILLTVAAVGLLLHGVTAIPLVPLVVNRAAELTVLHVTDSPIHLWLGGVQVVLAFMAGALYLEEEEYFQLRFVGEDVHCSGAMIVMAVLALIEGLILCGELLYHAQRGSIRCLKRQSGDAGEKIGSMHCCDPVKGKDLDSLSMFGGLKIMAGLSPVSDSPAQAGSPNGSAISAGGSGKDLPLAMQPWQLGASAAAASGWLREGAITSDWWQMPQEAGAGADGQLTVRGLNGEALVLNEAPKFEHNVDIQISSLEEEPGTFEPSYARRAPHTAAPVDDSFTAVQLSSEEETPSASLQRRLEQQLREELEAQHEQQRSS